MTSHVTLRSIFSGDATSTPIPGDGVGCRFFIRQGQRRRRRKVGSESLKERERESVCVCEWDTERERVCVCEWVTERKRERVLALRGCRGLFLGSVRARFSPGIPLRRVLDLTEPEGLGFVDRLGVGGGDEKKVKS